MAIMRRFRLAGLGLVALLGLGGLPFTVQSQGASRSAELVRNNSLGIALMEQLKFEEAGTHFAKNLELDPNFVPAWVNLGISSFYLQDDLRALEQMQQALRHDPKQIRAYFILGLIYRNQDNVPKALEAFGKVNQLDPADPVTNYFLGLIHSRQKDYAQAIYFLEKAIQLQPYNGSARYNLAQALLRSGDTNRGRQEIGKFRRLQTLTGTSTIGLQYFEQGQYALVWDDLSDYLPQTPQPEAPPVTFEDVAVASGLDFRHLGPGTLTDPITDLEDLQQRAIPLMGSGLSWGDYDGDRWLDLYLANASSSGASGALYRNRGDGTFVEVTRSAGINYRGKTMASLWGDYDNDHKLDLYLVNAGNNVLYRNQGDGRFSDVTSRAGVGDAAFGVGGAFLDYDHDGDLDLAVANFLDPAQALGQGDFPRNFAGAPNRLFSNNGDGTFSDVSQLSGLHGGSRRTLALMPTDFDNARDIDIYYANYAAANQLFSNLRDGTFEDVAASFGVAAGALAGVSVADFNRDKTMDLALVGAGSVGGLWLNGLRAGFQRQPLPVDQSSFWLASHFFDYDNDGDLDLLLVGGLPFGPAVEGQPNLVLLENRGGRLSDATEEVGLNDYGDRPIRGVSIADYDHDGDLDIAANVNGGRPLLLRNQGGNRNNWLQIDLSGTNSNSRGIGAKVQILAGRLQQKLEVAGGHGFESQHPARLHFGLGQADKVDAVRLIWPGGVLQAEIDQAANRLIRLEELDRKGTSCPILYFWDGESYQFLTDFLGGSAIGSLLAPGSYNYPDTDEFIKLDRSRLRLKENKLAITLNNQLEEVIFFDQLRAVAVDHPPEYDVVPDEKLLPGPPYPEFRLLSVSRPAPPRSAVDGAGRDILSQISRVDRVYPDLFRQLPFKGYATPHEIVLDLGPVAAERVILLMHAWIDYAVSTSNLAAHQAGVRLIPPYLQVEDEQGNWVTVIERMGFPAGLPKLMTVDLSGLFLSASRRVKIVTNMRIYWDQILVESGPARRDYRISWLDPERAELRYHGFPEFSSPDGRAPKVYFYDRLQGENLWKTHIGGYTRFGDARPLLKSRDDQFVITRAGDEIEALFELASLPPLPSGWVRDYLIYVDGFGKDMDINSAAPDFVGPLPFHGMSAFPLPEGESYPLDQEHQQYLQQWNTRFVNEWYPRLEREVRQLSVQPTGGR